MDNQESNYKPLGLIELPSNTFEHDVAVSEHYQSFSSELLRLALLGIAVIGFFVTNIVWKNTGEDIVARLTPKILSDLKTILKISLLCLAASAACSLIHRYVGSDSIAFHLESIRRYTRQAKDDVKKAVGQADKRNFRFQLSRWLLFISALFLWVGAIVLAIAFIKVL